MKEKIVQSFNRGAETYHSAAIVQSQIVASLVKRLPILSTENILEIGCGTGLLSRELTQRFPSASLLLTDIAPDMIRTCKKNFADQPRIQFSCMDGEALKLNESFDLIISSTAMHWFTDIKNSFKKIIENLAPGGQFVFAMLGENSLHEWRHICEENQFANPMPIFPSAKMLREYFPEFKIEVDTLLQPYSSMHDFLHSLKNLGATATRTDYVPLSIANLRRLLQKFNNKIDMTYEVIYGSYLKC